MMPGSLNDRVVLNNGVEMPWLGYGVFQIDDGPAVEQAVLHALGIGYRSIDTAAVYRNERGVGTAIRNSGIRREDIFLTTKVWNGDQREDRTLAAFDESLDRLAVDYVDLYLVHWPVAGYYRRTWEDMEKILEGGRARAIGVSNFMPHHLDDLLSSGAVVPAVNQVEFHPRLVQPDLLNYCRDKGIVVEAWSPLMQGHVAGNAAIRGLADKYGKTPAQIVLRWDLQLGVVTIPKSERPERIAENTAVFDFELDAEDLQLLSALDEGHRYGPDPDNFNF